MYLPKSRLVVVLDMTNATLDQQMSWFPTGLLKSQAAFDLTVTSPLNPSILSEVEVTAESTILRAKCRKHDSNDPKSQRPMAAGMLRV